MSEITPLLDRVAAISERMERQSQGKQQAVQRMTGLLGALGNDLAGQREALAAAEARGQALASENARLKEMLGKLLQLVEAKARDPLSERLADLERRLEGMLGVRAPHAEDAMPAAEAQATGDADAEAEAILPLAAQEAQPAVPAFLRLAPTGETAATPPAAESWSDEQMKATAAGMRQMLRRVGQQRQRLDTTDGLCAAS